MPERQRVVVTGIGIFSALGKDKAEVLKNLHKNKTGIADVTRFSTAEMLSHIGAEIKEFTEITPNPQINLCMQIGIQAAQEALADSGLAPTILSTGQVALSFGTCNGGIAEFEKARKLNELDYDSTINFPLFQQGDGIASYLGITGPVFSDVTACAASGHALSTGYELLAQGRVSAVLAGGADTMSETVYAGFNSLQSLSTTPCAPFGYPTGLSLGEGAAFLVLETLEKAQARKARIYAEICGYGLEQDAYHITAPHPEGNGIARAISSALRQGEIGSEQIDYINVHGTGTEANDACELKGLAQALGESFPQIPLSSSKSYFGHTLGAAAIIEIACSLLAIGEGFLPATLQTQTLREDCTAARHILGEMQPGQPAYFLGNNSAFGGHNSSILFRNWSYNQDSATTVQGGAGRRVGILGISLVNRLGQHSWHDQACLTVGTPKELEESRREVKEFIASYYARRMSVIAQYCIAGIIRALQDAGMAVTEENSARLGLIFGTMYGASESFSKYLRDIFERGLNFASALYFPDTSANTTPGHAAIKLGIRGSGTTISTGGNEGIYSAYLAYSLINNGSQEYCLAGAADESSAFSQEVSRILGLNQGRYPLSEGSSFLLLGDLEQEENRRRCYGAILGFGFSFGLANYNQAVLGALSEARLDPAQIDFVFYNDNGLSGQEQEQVLLRLFAARPIPIKSFTDILGYSLAVSSVNHICLAADWLRHNPELRWGIVASSSYNGGNAALVIGRVE